MTRFICYKKLTMLLLVSLCLILSIIIVASNTSTVMAAPKDSNDYTIGEIETILFKYFEEQGYSFVVGSQELHAYLLSQLLEDKDEVLTIHPKYELILYYAAEYLYQLEDYMICQENNKNTFSLEHIQNTTIGQIKQDVVKEELKIEQELTLFREQNPDVVSPLQSYSGWAARQYAYAWVYSHNPNYPVYIANCTNFVSQCVRAGGKQLHTPVPVPGGINETTTFWYAMRRGHGWGVSTSWIRVIDFHTYWNRYLLTVTSHDKNTIYNNGWVGDVVQLRRQSDGRWYHSMLITRKESSNLWFTYHSGPEKDKPFSEISAQMYRVIKFVGS